MKLTPFRCNRAGRCAWPRCSVPVPSWRRTPRPLRPRKINLNTATAEQLSEVPGVGPKLAQRIVEHRQKEGAFRSMAELMNVKGVGEKNLAKIQGYLVVGDALAPRRQVGGGRGRRPPAAVPAATPVNERGMTLLEMLVVVSLIALYARGGRSRASRVLGRVLHPRRGALVQGASS